ncbi:unnamed protein product [Paramecium pentaurelia]|uniref:VLIG-type G domain-containing protein n=1 Tax=Paramecium pentaurelia TaxID=43138 RepID=A0A8S1UFK5_9CILI|nr:unnamed protein product [Paramecium pentaurelia]
MEKWEKILDFSRNYKQKDQGQDFQYFKCIEQFENTTKPIDFKQSIKPEKFYIQLLTCPSGNTSILPTIIVTAQKCKESSKFFADFSDVIVIGLSKEKKNKIVTKAKIIGYLVSLKKLINKKIKKKKLSEISLIKFGPNSQFLFKEKKSKINIYINKEYYDIIEPYLNIMNMNEIILSFSKIQCTEFKSEQIINIIYSIQLNTSKLWIQTAILTLNQNNEGLKSQKQLHLGFLEDHLTNYNNKIFVVGKIGRQSSGKSYLLNRVFSTHFSVLSARFTDGVWGSIAYREDQKFQRNKNVSIFTALCYITILNCEKNFDRHYEDLFKHLVEASKQLKDEKLFKGIVYFVISDVSSNDNKVIKQELLKNLEQLKEVNNENQQFDKQLIIVRQYFLDNSRNTNGWKNGIELVQIMKILLCQLELSDNTNASLIQLKIKIEKNFEESKELWRNLVQLNQSQYKFQKFNDHECILIFKDDLKQLYKDLEDSIQTHNKNLLEAKSQFNQMMEFRKQQIIQRKIQETSKVQIIIKNNMSKLHSFLVDQMNQYEFCLVKCNLCHLLCKQFKFISKYLNNLTNLQMIKQIICKQIFHKQKIRIKKEKKGIEQTQLRKIFKRTKINFECSKSAIKYMKNKFKKIKKKLK